MGPAGESSVTSGEPVKALNLNENPQLHLLFICSKNQWRSPTAETVFRSRASVAVRSAGTSRRAKRTVTSRDLQWADLIFAMESKHKQRLLADFPGELRFKEIVVLEIPDEYRPMDPELIELLELQVIPILESYDA